MEIVDFTKVTNHSILIITEGVRSEVISGAKMYRGSFQYYLAANFNDMLAAISENKHYEAFRKEINNVEVKSDWKGYKIKGLIDLR